ncbi:MAG: phospholipid scramblase-related protein [Myxococcota bacterium]|nr:phospholipid scramblase-related protein [Myxococcota bacterium]
MKAELSTLLQSTSKVMIRQIKEWGEIVMGFESANKYELLDDRGQRLAMMGEQSGGFMDVVKRQLLRAHRPMTVKVLDNQGQELLTLERPFFFMFSSLQIASGGRKLGSVERRWAFLHKRYELLDAAGSVVAQIQAPIWKLWTFPILDAGGAQIGSIQKKWGGLFKEAFSDADTFGVEFPSGSPELKAICLACAISVDLDFFENRN